MRGYLLVQAGGAPYGLRVDQVLEVRDGFEVHPAPSIHPAVRGVTPAHGRLVPLIHLGALVTNGMPSDEPCPTLVLAHVAERLLAFEVEDAEEVVSEDLLPVPDAWQLPWASGVAERDSGMIPVIDVELLAERLSPVETGELI